jgi:hypothetical protein
MTELEMQHFYYFLAAFQEDFPNLKPSQEISLVQAAIEYINLLRTQARQLETGEVISMARQHPGVQLRAWLDALGVNRKQQARDDKAEEGTQAALKASLERLSS